MIWRIFLLSDEFKFAALHDLADFSFIRRIQICRASEVNKQKN